MCYEFNRNEDPDRVEAVLLRPSLQDHIQDERDQDRIRRATVAAEADYEPEEVPVPEVVPVDVATSESDSPLYVKEVKCRRTNCEHTVSYQNNIFFFVIIGIYYTSFTGYLQSSFRD